MRLVLLLSITTLVMAGEVPQVEAPKVKLPAMVESVESSWIRDIDQAKVDYDRAVKASTDRYKRALEAEMKKAMASGNLDLANIINEKIKNATIVLAAEQIPPPTKSEEPTKLTYEAIVGTWQSNRNQNIYIFKSDKTATSGTAKGTCKIEDNKIVVTWDSGYIDTLTIEGDVITVMNNKGVTHTLAKAK